MFEVAMQAEREVTTLKNQLKQRDETIKQLKEALRGLLKIIEDEDNGDALFLVDSEFKTIDKARKLIE